MAPLFQSHINSIQKLNNIVIFCLTYLCPSMISNEWRHDTSQDWEYLAKNYNNLTTALIPDKTLLRLSVHILSTGYLENFVFCFIEVTEHYNIGFNCKVVKNEDGKEDSKEAVINSEKKASKEWA